VRWRAAAAATTAATCCAQWHKRHAVDERHAHDYQLKSNLFVTMQEEIGTARRMVRVSRDALTSELLWALLQCGDNCLTWEEHELPSGRFCALRQRRRHCVVDLPARGRA
jgi:hypothetical protein